MSFIFISLMFFNAMANPSVTVDAPTKPNETLHVGDEHMQAIQQQAHAEAMAQISQAAQRARQTHVTEPSKVVLP